MLIQWGCYKLQVFSSSISSILLIHSLVFHFSNCHGAASGVCPGLVRNRHEYMKTVGSEDQMKLSLTLVNRGDKIIINAYSSLLQSDKIMVCSSSADEQQKLIIATTW